MSEAFAKSASGADQVRTAALAAHDDGLCVIPIRADGTKRPDVPSWAPYQKTRPAQQQVATWFALQQGRTGLAVVAGAVSGGVEVLDFDDVNGYDEFVDKALAGPQRELVTRIGKGYHARTPGGHHLAYRCATIAGNQKLASRLKRPDEQCDEHDRVQVLIETRGEGGYFIVPPSNGKVHPSGEAYRFLSGGFSSIATITPEERESLLNFARSFDAVPKQESPTPKPNGSRRSATGDRPGDIYNATANWNDLLTRHGYSLHHERDGGQFWTRPGKDRREGHSASTNFHGSGLLYVFSTSTAFEAQRGYDLFGAYAVLEHDGDHGAAARAINEVISNRKHTSDLPEPAPAVVARDPGKAAEAPPREPEKPESERPEPGVERDRPPAPRLLTADEFATDVAPEAIVLGLIYVASTTLATGASKTGKTWFVLQLALSVIAGVEFLGLETQPAVVLLCSLELSAGMLRKRIEELCRTLDLPAPRIGENLHVVAPTADYVPALNLGSETGCADLKILIEQTGATIVILDTLYRFIPGCDPNDNKEMGRVFGRLNDLAQGTGAALLIVDHMGKGEQLGPVSHSALGASVKGGAARAVAALKRTSKEDGGRWELNVESHFGNWEEPLYFERPRLEGGKRGGGCVLCTASEAHGLDEATVRRVFANYGERVDGRPVIRSKRKLSEALQAEKLCSGNSQGDEMVRAIVVDFCAPDTAHTWGKDRPIVTSKGPRNATIFTWRMVEREEPCAA